MARPGKAIFSAEVSRHPCRTGSHEQIECRDYVKLLQAPVGTWNGETYRVSIDGDCHNFNYRSDIFSNADLGSGVDVERRRREWGPPADLAASAGR